MREKQEGSSMKEKMKEGISVEEIEIFARKHLTEVFLILAIIIATISSIFDFFTGSSLSVLFAGLGGIISIGAPIKTLQLEKKGFHFLGKQEKSVQIIIGIVRIIVAMFIPFVIFAELGLLSGIAFHSLFRHSAKTESKGFTTEPSDREEEEHL
ncbi:MAG: hypothetical protein JW769_04495 [Parachlamydiales bacterium]|nr:hypothetical protein [Parachlamydiales bacterium]